MPPHSSLGGRARFCLKKENTHTHIEETHREGDMKIKAEMGVMWLLTKENLEPFGRNRHLPVIRGNEHKGKGERRSIHVLQAV